MGGARSDHIDSTRQNEKDRREEIAVETIGLEDPDIRLHTTLTEHLLVQVLCLLFADR